MLICSLTKLLSLKTLISCFSHDLELLCLLVSLPKYWHFHQQCVMCRVQAIHEAMSDCLNAGLIDHHSSHCIVCNPAAGPHSPDHNSFDDHDHFGFAQQVVLFAVFSVRLEAGRNSMVGRQEGHVVCKISHFSSPQLCFLETWG